MPAGVTQAVDSIGLMVHDVFQHVYRWSRLDRCVVQDKTMRVYWFPVLMNLGVALSSNYGAI